jgi:hypothetical protein
MSEPDLNYWRDKIRELMRRVPERVNAGGIQTARAYKEAVTFANKQLTASRPTLLNMKTAAQKLQAYQ